MARQLTSHTHQQRHDERMRPSGTQPLLALILPASHEPPTRTAYWSVCSDNPCKRSTERQVPNAWSSRSLTHREPESPRTRSPTRPTATGAPEAPNHSRNTLV